MKPIASIIVTYRHDLTASVIDQLSKESELTDIIIIDAKGDYKKNGIERDVIVPNFNCGWLRGNNIALSEYKDKYEYFLLLNNDIVLSDNFIKNTYEFGEKTRCGLFSSCYDDVWPFMYPKTNHRNVAAKDFKYNDYFWQVPFVDGTAMTISKGTLDKIGLLDEENFGNYGWGGEMDYAIRVKLAKDKILVTESCFHNHMRAATHNSVTKDYHHLAGQEMNCGMIKKWGDDWHRLRDCLDI